MINITSQQLRRAADIKENIQSLQEELSQLLGGAGETAAVETPKKGKISAAGIARIVAATKARWARINAAKAGKAVQKPRRKLSAAGRARLAALARARWAKVKKAGKSRL